MTTYSRINIASTSKSLSQT